jgi:hypothetical protein
MSAAISTQDWLAKVLEAAEEVASTTFNTVANDVQHPNALPVGKEGSLLSVQRGRESIHLGVMADQAGCIALTRALLQMEDDEEVVEEDVTDAVGEIINILAGVVQRALDGNGAAVTLGLPVYIRGEICAPSHSEAVCANLDLGPARADIIVVRGDVLGTETND